MSKKIRRELEKPVVKPLRLGRGKRRLRKRSKKSIEEQAERFKELERQFRTLGRIIGREETFKAKLNSAICYGLAEVCETLTQIVEGETKVG